jgi:choline dehydrogenase-like flavoprotein
VRGDIVGGRSLLWGRACYRWSDHEFEANLKDGHGVDWPIRYKDLAPWYDYVERFVGISGNKDGIDIVPDGQFQPPFEMNCVEKDFKKRLESKYQNRHVIIGRTANLTQPVSGRTQCQVRNLCIGVVRLVRISVPMRVRCLQPLQQVISPFARFACYTSVVR